MSETCEIIQKMSVLIVDDSYLMRGAIRNILKLEGDRYVVDEAEDGLQAMDKIKNNEYHVILLDIEMPNMNGLEFLKRSKLYSDADVIDVSSLARKESIEVEKAVCFGAFDVVEKPCGVMSIGMEIHKQHEILNAIHRSIAVH